MTVEINPSFFTSIAIFIDIIFPKEIEYLWLYLFFLTDSNQHKYKCSKHTISQVAVCSMPLFRPQNAYQAFFKIN